MKYQIFIMKSDLRCNGGYRFHEERIATARSNDEIKDFVRGMRNVFPTPKFMISFQPLYKTVTNLMSGTEVEIRSDTPHCCDPSTETYWSI